MPDSVDGKGKSGPPIYEDARAALTAILVESSARRQRSYFHLTSTKPPNPVDWSSAAAAVVAETVGLSLDADRFWALDAALDDASDRESSEAIRRVLQTWADANWAELEGQARATALKRFEKMEYQFQRDFQAHIERWPRLRDDRELLSSALGALELAAVKLDIAVAQLRHLHGDEAAAERVLAAVTSARSGFSERDEFASLVAEWSGDSVWGQLQHALWRTGTKPTRAQTVLDSLPAPIIETAALLQEFGLTIARNPSYALAELSPETRLSWRDELSKAVGDDSALRAAATEALLWFASARDDRAAIFAVLDLHRSDGLVALERFRSHPHPLVRRRAAAVIALATGVPDASELLRSAGAPTNSTLPVNAGRAGSVRTWIGDARIEYLIEFSLNETAHQFGNEVWHTRDSGEETHLAILFERLGAAFARISKTLAMLAAEKDANDRLEIKLEHRIVGKAEEGGPGVNAKRFSTDVCLLFEAREKGRRFARRASFLQSKRIYVKRGTPEFRYYPVKAEQLKELAAQTMASFLLLLGPTSDQVAIPVIPARLFLEMVERGERATEIAPAAASRLGKSIGTWLLEDVIGLWTGDWNETIVRKAEGGGGREPYLLVEIIANRVSKGPDGWVP
jgi:hypothetical protein